MGMNISLNTVNFGFVAENNRFIIVHINADYYDIYLFDSQCISLTLSG